MIMNQNDEINQMLQDESSGDFPRVYRFSPVVRTMTMIIAAFALIYSIWFIFSIVNVETKLILKILPVIIAFLSAQTLIRHSLSLQKVILESDRIVFYYVIRKPLVINYYQIKRMEITNTRPRSVKIIFESSPENLKAFFMHVGFPHMVEILNGVVERTRNLELDEFLSATLIDPKK
jgi:hypothetical protein